jgi:hypothetical protein
MTSKLLTLTLLSALDCGNAAREDHLQRFAQ